MDNTALDVLHTLKVKSQVLESSLNAQQEILQMRGIKLTPEIFSVIATMHEELETLSSRFVEETTSLGLLRMLAGISEQINSSLNLDEVLDQAMERVITLTEAERGYIILSNSNPFELDWDVRIARDPDVPPGAPPEFKGSRSIVREVLETGKSLLTNNAFNDPRLENNSTVAAQNLRSVLAVPLKRKADVIGVVYVDNRLRAGLFTVQAERLLTAFAHQASIAIGNAHLFARVQESLDTIAELKELMDNIFTSIGSGVITTNEADEVIILNRAAERILACVEAEVIGLPLLDLMPKSNIDLADYLRAVHESDENQIVDAELESANLGRLSLNIKLSPVKDSNQATQQAARRTLRPRSS
jgi:GAF domain-containing protein